MENLVYLGRIFRPEYVSVDLKQIISVEVIRVFTEVYLKHTKQLESRFFAKIIDSLKPLIILAKRSIIDVCQGLNYASRF